ncbi:histone-lysine N-methyltransferase ASHH1 [Cucurbita pepo subsp. pepo]|uniref:histone-lysine N-methyltransferase ASHH1 n=1 Tax=Cucurbita pepo subsp. pepo TaxID=3664 RepID=UPI000C9D2D72|nr:histone-lysine N-methyltransferase ASHH1 [Cucurbita pepo subsp. pepo]
MDQHIEGLPHYKDIKQNEFCYRKHKKQKEEDIAVCVCKFDANDNDSGCGEGCLNVLTSTECTPGYCPSGVHCRNQRFQKCEYARTKLFNTEGRGWGLLADENIKSGQFIIEYCGEVISWKEAKRRSHTYENQGLKDAYIISLNASESIDATRKGSLARFINHSCCPNCETRKWNVLGEIRVGIFAKQDISIGTELSYDYNFEWYGGAKVRCLCGASSCSGFLGAKSRGFLEDTYLWEDDDDRYSVEKIPLYDSAEDEPFVKLHTVLNNPYSEFEGYLKNENPMILDDNLGAEQQLVSTALIDTSKNSVQLQNIVVGEIKNEAKEEPEDHPQNTQQTFSQQNAMISRIRSNTACRNYRIGPGPAAKKRARNLTNGRTKNFTLKQVDAKYVARLLELKEAQEEVLQYEETKNKATSELDLLYNEIRPAIEEYERDSQDSVATSVAEKWIEASCLKLKAEFDLYSSIVRNVACTPLRSGVSTEPQPLEVDGDNDLKLLTN